MSSGSRLIPGGPVLGARQGIGEQATHALAQASAPVLCVDRDAASAARTMKTVRGVADIKPLTATDDTGWSQQFDIVRGGAEAHAMTMPN
jgi:NADP-dependent 3-hydroxy acid dehydrogenase YdfG